MGRVRSLGREVLVKCRELYRHMGLTQPLVYG